MIKTRRGVATSGILRKTIKGLYSRLAPFVAGFYFKGVNLTLTFSNHISIPASRHSKVCRQPRAERFAAYFFGDA